MTKKMKSDCGCGQRAIKVVRWLGVEEDVLSDDYIEKHHAKATARALWLRLRGKHSPETREAK